MTSHVQLALLQHSHQLVEPQPFLVPSLALVPPKRPLKQVKQEPAESLTLARYCWLELAVVQAKSCNAPSLQQFKQSKAACSASQAAHPYQLRLHPVLFPLFPLWPLLLLCPPWLPLLLLRQQPLLQKFPL